MIRFRVIVLGTFVLSGLGGQDHPRPVTLTGWFSDEGCAAGPVAHGIIGPNNPECVKTCLEKGAQAVFVSEQGKEMLTVKGYARVKDDLGYHLEITGLPEPASNSIIIQTVKRIGEYQGPSCARPKKAAK
jgi:hypothetical protein